MLIIKRAVPAIVKQAAVRSVLTRLDVDRLTDRYDIYIESKSGISCDYVTIYDQRYVNIRVMVGKKIISFQINLKDCDMIEII